MVFDLLDKYVNTLLEWTTIPSTEFRIWGNLSSFQSPFDGKEFQFLGTKIGPKIYLLNKKIFFIIIIMMVI